MAETAHIGPWLRTVAHLRPAQVAHRVRLRGLRAVDPWLAPLYRRVPAGLAGGWPEKFASIDSRCSWGDADAVAAGTFTFLNRTRSLGEPADWTQAGAAHLWRFNLHYMEWAYALADAGRQEDFARLWRSWSSAVGFAHRDAWSPYVASLRAWVLRDTLESLVRRSDLEAKILVTLWQHRSFLRVHVESGVGRARSCLSNPVIRSSLKARRRVGFLPGPVVTERRFEGDSMVGLPVGARKEGS